MINSLLQKAIRRGESELAQRAVLTFLHQKGSALWRRLMIIACEDVGAASAEVVVSVAVACTDAAWRRRAGGDVSVAVDLAQLLANACKSRSAEHLITTSKYHPVYSAEKYATEGVPIAENVRILSDHTSTLVRRSLSALRLSGLTSSRRRTGEDFQSLLSAYRALGAPSELVDAVEAIAFRAREPMAILVPLLWLEARRAGAVTLTVREMPGSPVVGDIPMYALDKHTLSGRAAIRKLVKSNQVLQDCLARYVDRRRWHDAAYMVAFYTDAAPLMRKFEWSQSKELERLGTEADFLKAGIPAEGMVPILDVFEKSICHLNELRADILRRRIPSTPLFAFAEEAGL